MALCCVPRAFAQETGTLNVDVKPYESEVKIKKNIAKQLEHGGIRWGFLDDELIVPLISEKYVKPELPHFTRYGESDEIELAPGDYEITSIGYEQKELSRNIDKVLSKSAYFNQRILSFSIQPGATTTLEILPRFKKTGKLIKVFMPDLHVKVVVAGAVKGEAVINERTSSSVPWDDYSGPLKF